MQMVAAYWLRLRVGASANLVPHESALIKWNRVSSRNDATLLSTIYT